MKNKISTFIYTAVIFASAMIISIPAYPETERIIPPLAKPFAFHIEFNGDYLRGDYLLLDFRTPEEKKRDTEKKSLAGDVIVFLIGHAQRADDGYSITSKLAAWSKSGIVIIPVCDTPFGENSEWRGDRGKDVILMEMIRHALIGIGMDVKNYKPLTDMKVKINKMEMSAPAKEATETEISFVGWSHGALLARRLSTVYPDSVNSLVQISPAGVVEWGNKYCAAPACLASNFMYESSCVGLGFFRGEGTYVVDAGWGGSVGLIGNTARSCTSCISGNFSFLKLLRPGLDLSDSTLFANDSNFPVSKLKNITVIFSSDDKLFEYTDDGGIKNPDNVTKEESDRFFEKFYPGAVKAGTKCNLAVLPGNHIGLLVNSEKFAEKALSTIGQKK